MRGRPTETEKFTAGDKEQLLAKQSAHEVQESGCYEEDILDRRSAGTKGRQLAILNKRSWGHVQDGRVTGRLSRSSAEVLS